MEEALRKLSALKTYSEELGLDLRRAEDRFKWLLASMLFAKRISADIAKRTFAEFVRAGLTSPERILEAGWDRLVEVLDAGGYVRYDFSTATNLLEMARLLVERYGGRVDAIHEAASDPRDLERRLMEIRGVGPVAVNIFLRELRGVWDKARPVPCRMALEVAERLGLPREAVEAHESRLVRLYLEYCKKRRCSECPLKSECRARRET